MDPRRRALLALVAAGATLRNAFAQDRIMTKPIPSTGEPLPIIGVGTWQTFDVGADAAARGQLREVIKQMTNAGKGVVDSSPMYGTSETVAGDLVAELGRSEERRVGKEWRWGVAAARGTRR